MQVGTNKHHNTHLHGLHSIPPCLGTLHAFGLLWLGFKIGPKLVGGWILTLLLCTSSSRQAIPPSNYVPHPGWMCYLEFGRKSLYSQISSTVLSWEDKCPLVLCHKKEKASRFQDALYVARKDIFGMVKPLGALLVQCRLV